MLFCTLLCASAQGQTNRNRAVKVKKFIGAPRVKEWGNATHAGFGNSFIGGAMSGLIVIFGVMVLGFTESAPQIALLFTCGSIGALVASMLLPLLRQRLRPGG